MFEDESLSLTFYLNKYKSYNFWHFLKSYLINIIEFYYKVFQTLVDSTRFLSFQFSFYAVDIIPIFSQRILIFE